MKKAYASKKPHLKSSRRVSSLCVDLKSQLEDFDKMPGPPAEEDVAEKNRRLLFTSLKEKIKTLSK